MVCSSSYTYNQKCYGILKLFYGQKLSGDQKLINYLASDIPIYIKYLKKKCIYIFYAYQPVQHISTFMYFDYLIGLK